MRLVIVDIDGTLTNGHLSTEIQFFLYLLRCGQIGPRQTAHYIYQLKSAWRLRGRHLLKVNKGYFAGLCVESVQQHVVSWLGSRRSDFWRSKMVARIGAHRRLGDYVVLLSGTPQPIASAIGALYDANEAIGSALPCSDGLYTGEVTTRHPFGVDKLSLAEELLERLGATAADAFAYGDSCHDIDLLNRVGRAVAVAPGRHLAQYARQNGWKIL